MRAASLLHNGHTGRASACNDALIFDGQAPSLRPIGDSTECDVVRIESANSCLSQLRCSSPRTTADPLTDPLLFRKLPACPDTTVPTGVVFLPFHFTEAAANLLTNGALEREGKNPEFKYCAARVAGAERPLDPPT